MEAGAVGIPDVVIIDDNVGLHAALRKQWPAIRTTKAFERIDGEFRRRTKTQGSLPSEDVVLLLLFGLLRTGNVKLPKMDGWQEMPKRTTVEMPKRTTVEMQRKAAWRRPSTDHYAPVDGQWNFPPLDGHD